MCVYDIHGAIAILRMQKQNLTQQKGRSLPHKHPRVDRSVVA